MSSRFGREFTTKPIPSTSFVSFQSLIWLSESKFFALDLTAHKTAEIVALTRPSVSRIFVKIRNRIAEECERASPFGGTVEVDESYFGARRVRGKRGRGALGKQIVFGIFKRNGS